MTDLQMLSLQRLLYQISEQRKLLKLENELEFSIESFWISIFRDYVLLNSKSKDDLIFFVNKDNKPNKVNVFRRNSFKESLNLKDKNILWEETVYLNLILQHFEYSLTCSICTKTISQDLQILKRHTQSVYPSPSKHRMDIKDEKEYYTYPNIYFAIDNYEEIYNHMNLKEDEILCVELVGHDRDNDIESVLFMGAVKYQILKNAHQNKVFNKEAFNQIFKEVSGNTNNNLFNDVNEMIINYNKIQFLKLKGPGGSGQAEMAVSFAPMDTSPHFNELSCSNISLLPLIRNNDLSKFASKKFSFIQSAPTTPRLHSPLSLNKDDKPIPCSDHPKYRLSFDSNRRSNLRKRLGGSLLGLRRLLSGENEEISEAINPNNFIVPDHFSERINNNSNGGCKKFHNRSHSQSSSGREFKSLPTSGIRNKEILEYYTSSTKLPSQITAGSMHCINYTDDREASTTNDDLRELDSIDFQDDCLETQGISATEKSHLYIKAQLTYISLPLTSIIENLFRNQQKPILTF